MKNDKKNDGFKSSIAMICVLAVVTVLCCGYLTLGHINPEAADSVKGAFTFLYKDGKTDNNTDKPKTDGDSASARLMFAGENLIYEAMYKEAKERAESGYDFSYIYKGIKDVISEADIAGINQATVISDGIQPSSYPKFCSPEALGDALCDAGFNVINQASKNIWDKGESGAKDTLEYWKTKQDVLLTGIYESEEDMNTAKVREVNGIKFAFISLTAGLNNSGYSESSGVRLITLDEKGKSQVDIYNNIKHIIKTAKDSADVVVVSVNFDGGETKEPTNDQQTCVNYLASFGADVIIGTGTHSVQPMEIRDNGDGTKTVIAHSLGNLMSAQTDKENMLGGIADIIYSKDSESGKVTLKSARIIPTVTMVESGKKNYRAVTLAEFTEEDGQNHAVSGFTYDFANDYFAEVIGDSFLEKTVMDEESLTTEPETSDTANTSDNSDASSSGTAE